ncbi:PH domain-containing protein [Melghirimyces algeriensis]|uniref:Putative membrane protein n=1 Tax=Melghirimyces algeriensis TaxID=910412 RepID=A0A521BH90_9BACL|nr:PH domain-containing protein [Melghirimyces algeriensis]SMO46453.1 putative membrane protein [Melghirimyces algeriensis]
MNKRRLHPSMILFSLLRGMKESVPGLLGIFSVRWFREGASFWSGGIEWFIGFLGIFFLLSLLSAVLRWYREKFWTEDGHFCREVGALFRKRVEIPLERIHSIDESETPFHRMFGVVQIQMETIGGDSEAEIQLKAVSCKDAYRLREELSRTVESDDDMQTTESAAPIRRINGQELFKAGVTSGRFGVIFGILGTVFSTVDDLFQWDWVEELKNLWESGIGFPIWILILVPLLLAWLFSILGTLVTHAHFTVRREKTHLIVERGLWERNRSTLPLKKIQAIHVIENPLRQLFGLVEVKVECAGYGEEEKQKVVAFPLLKRTELTAFLEAFFPEYATVVQKPLHSPPDRCFKWGLMFEIPVLLIAGALWFFFPSWGGWTFLLLPLGVLYDLLTFRDAGWALDGDCLVIRSRGINRKTILIPRRAMQCRTMEQTPLGRWQGWACFATTLASGEEYETSPMERKEVLQLIQALDPEPGWKSDQVAKMSG